MSTPGRITATTDRREPTGKSLNEDAEDPARATTKHMPPAKRHGIYYGTRKLPQGQYGINVAGFWRGELLFTDHNSTRWPSVAVALDMARSAALAWAQKQHKSLPVIADTSTTREVWNAAADVAAFGTEDRHSNIGTGPDDRPRATIQRRGSSRPQQAGE
jgi:hypothetical protein